MFISVLYVSWYVHSVQENIKVTTQLKIAEQKKVLGVLFEVINNDGADAVVEAIIKDCSIENREHFDTQLGNLANLKGQELVEMEQLFNACGNFFSERKAVMVARLQREYEVYLDLIEIFSAIDSNVEELTHNAGSWGTLVELETKRSVLSTKLVAIQGSIIDSLQVNVSINSDQMQATLVEGQRMKEELRVLSGEINQLRQAVLDI